MGFFKNSEITEYFSHGITAHKSTLSAHYDVTFALHQPGSTNAHTVPIESQRDQLRLEINMAEMVVYFVFFLFVTIYDSILSDI